MMYRGEEKKSNLSTVDEIRPETCINSMHFTVLDKLMGTLIWYP